MAKLTARQRRFVEEYLVDLNATQAAIRAGYSDKTAEQISYKLVQKSSVQEALKAAIQERSARTGITQNAVVEELGKVAFAKAADCSDSDLKYSNKLRALELLGKHLGMFDGNRGQGEKEENNLLQAIADSTDREMDTDDVPEIQ